MGRPHLARSEVADDAADGARRPRDRMRRATVVHELELGAVGMGEQRRDDVRFLGAAAEQLPDERAGDLRRRRRRVPHA
jgi:hypothetical protein